MKNSLLLLVCIYIVRANACFAQGQLRDGTVVKGPNGAAYVIELGTRRAIPDTQTFDALLSYNKAKHKQKSLQTLTQSELDGYSVGKNCGHRMMVGRYLEENGKGGPKRATLSIPDKWRLVDTFTEPQKGTHRFRATQTEEKTGWREREPRVLSVTFVAKDGNGSCFLLLAPYDEETD